MPRSRAADDGEDFRSVYEHCYPDVTAYVRRRVHPDDVEDVVAETFAVVWKRWQDVPRGEAAVPWVYGVAKRVLSGNYRSASRRKSLIERVGTTTRAGEPDVADLIGDDRVSAVLARMRPGDRELLMLHYWEGLSAPDIAAVLGRSAGALRLALHRARQRFLAIWKRTVDLEPLSLPLGWEES